MADAQLNVQITRPYDIDGLIDLIENGGPVQAKRLYQLVKLPGGVPIDTSEFDVVEVIFQSPYIEGEKAVVKTLFSEYLGVNGRLRYPIARIRDVELDINRGSAVSEKSKTESDSSKILGHRPVTNTVLAVILLDFHSHNSTNPQPTCLTIHVGASTEGYHGIIEMELMHCHSDEW